MSKFRRIIFYIFVLIYITLCPVVILYALGYIIDPIHREMEHTGLIYLSTTPSGATIRLEKSRFKQKTPATLSELLPGEYTIRINLAGYRPWIHKITVESGKAAAFENIFLIPDAFRQEKLSLKKYDRLIPLNREDLFVVSEKSDLGSFYTYDLKDKKIKLLVDEHSPWSNFTPSVIFNEKKSRIMIASGGALWEKKWLYLDLSREKPDPVDISALINEKPDFILWDPAYDANVFTVRKNKINRFDIKTKALYPDYITEARGLGLSDKKILVLDKENNLIRYSYNNKDDPKTIVLGSVIFETFINDDGFYIIDSLDGKTLTFMNEKGRLVTNVWPYELSSDGVKEKDFYKPAHDLLFCTDKSIKVAHYLSLSSENFFPGSAQVKEVYAHDGNIEQCLWAYGNSHIIFRENNEIFLLEIEPQGASHVEWVTKIKKGTSFFYSPRTGSIYFINDESFELNSIKVIPRENIIFVPMIENSKQKE